ncbi:MAG: CRISPR-associated helicase Cas3' [Ruminiclostridium sp.]
MFCAHINPHDLKEQSVKEHLTNVSELCMEYCEKISLGYTGKLVGILHDLGKETNEFDNYIHYSVANPKDKSRRGTINHSTAGAKLIYDYFYNSKDQYQKLAAQLISVAICSHHGGLLDCLDLQGFDKFTDKMNKDLKEIQYNEAVSIFNEECLDLAQINELFEKSKGEIKLVFAKIIAIKFKNFSIGLLQKYIFSCVIDADRFDTYTFMECKEKAQPIEKTKLWEELSSKLEKKLASYPKSSKIDLLREEISLSCKAFAKHKTGIYQLCVPTGGGKTLSSLRYALEHAKEFKKDRIFYIIPFTTIIDQNAKEIKDILKRDDVILEHHSNLVIDNEDEDYKLLTERWDSPIILTTMVQFLNSLFSGGTQGVRRMHNLANSIIIFDEIQAIPIKCINMFNIAMNFLSVICNTTIILCTATQPLLTETDKPLLLSENAGIIQNVEEKFREFKRTNIENRTRIGGYDAGTLKEFALEIMGHVNSILIILNTKNAAKEVFNAIQEENKLLPVEKQSLIFHLSTNMCPSNRIEILDEIRKKLGHSRIICISTQLIEAGVNISFECVIRSLAGLDSIAQAAGRCNRHGEKACSDVYIVNMNNEDVSKLIDIKKGQEITKRILDDYETNPESFGRDLLSPKALEIYYYYYFHKRGLEMNYTMPEPNRDKTMFELLAENSRAIDAYNSRNGTNPNLILGQAFKTAGDNFCVIDNNTTGIVVPYGKGEELIAKINGNCDIFKLKYYLKEAQQYSVNLFDLDFYKLEKLNAFYRLNNGGVIALRKEFYNENIGVTTEEQQQEFLKY